MQINGQLRSDRVDDLYLSRIGGSYVVELLGRTGEARTGRNINVTFRRPGFKNTRNVTLKTDAAGGIELGALDGISSIAAKAPDGHQRSWRMSKARRTQPGEIHAVAGDPVRIPYFGDLDRAELALLAVSSGGHTADVFERLKLEDGFLTAAKLPAGDYRLFLKRSHEALMIRVAKGKTSAGHVFNAARSLELDTRPPAHLADAAVRKKALEIKVANADELTRVHVVATRFLPDYDVFAGLGLAPTAGLYRGQPSQLPNLFLSGRKIGDEFRYILERRYGRKLPGNMLERPEILLNPWAVRDTEAGAEQLATGDAYDRKVPGKSGRGSRAPSKQKKADGGGEGSPRTVSLTAVSELFLSRSSFPRPRLLKGAA